MMKTTRCAKARNRTAAPRQRGGPETRSSKDESTPWIIDYPALYVGDRHFGRRAYVAGVFKNLGRPFPERNGIIDPIKDNRLLASRGGVGPYDRVRVDWGRGGGPPVAPWELDLFGLMEPVFVVHDEAFEFAAELAPTDGTVQLFARSEGSVGAGALGGATIIQSTGGDLRPRVLDELGERLFAAVAAHGNSTGRARTQGELDYLVERAQIHQFTTMAADRFPTEILRHLVDVEDTIRKGWLSEARYTDADLAQAILLCTRLSGSGALGDKDQAKLRQIQRAVARAMAER